MSRSRVSGGDPESLFETYKKEHGSERLCSQGEPVPDSNHALSIPNIQELLGIVKNGRSRVSGGDPDGTTVRIFDKKSFPRERGTLSSMAVSEDIYLAECVTQIADDLLSIFMR